MYSDLKRKNAQKFDKSYKKYTEVLNSWHFDNRNYPMKVMFAIASDTKAGITQSFPVHVN